MHPLSGSTVETLQPTSAGYSAGVFVAVLVFVLWIGFTMGSKLPQQQIATSSTSRSEQVVQSVQRNQEVVLVSLGIQGINEERVDGTLFGRRISGSSRVEYLEYSYRAKLRIDATRVRIVETGENTYKITIPEFQFLGHGDAKFRTVVEDNGVVSFLIPEVNTSEAITTILNDDTRLQHIVDHEDLLREQTETFYTGIVSAVDPEAQLTFEFRGAEA